MNPPATAEAVKSFQTSQGLPATGKVDVDVESPSKTGEDWTAKLAGMAILFETIIGVIAGTGAIGPEIDDGSIVYLLAKPLDRYSIVVTKLAVAIAVVVAFGVVPVAIAGVILTGELGTLTVKVENNTENGEGQTRVVRLADPIRKPVVLEGKHTSWQPCFDGMGEGSLIKAVLLPNGPVE